jgi:flagellar basal-body rod modification protein FlgD
MLTNSFNPAAGPTGTGNTNGNGVLAAGETASETADMFTKLLVAQIRNQDPLAPSDPSQFVNQLAQLSQTEALQSVSKMTSSSASVLQSLQVLALGAQVGAEVMASSSTVRLDGHPVEGAITLGSSSATTTLVLTGADQRQHKVALGPRPAGTAPFTIDPVALGLPPGAYALQVQTSSGETPALEIAGRLDSVRMSPTGGIVLKVANLGEIPPSAVTGFNGKSGTTASAAAPYPASN